MILENQNEVLLANRSIHSADPIHFQSPQIVSDMKTLTSVLILFCTASLQAQGPSASGQTIFQQLTADALIITSQGLFRGLQEASEFLPAFALDSESDGVYRQDYTAQVNASLSYEIGEIESGAGSFPIMFIKSMNEPDSPEIELLVIYERESTPDDSQVLDDRRKEWMELCNSHQASRLVKQLYHKDAYYYNRGRLIQGTKALTSEYSYMNASSYSLTLTPGHVLFASENVAYEIGQCSGSYPFPYLLLWSRQDDGSWKIMLDSNY